MHLNKNYYFQNIQYQVSIYQELVFNAVQVLSDCELSALSLYKELNSLAMTAINGNCVKCKKLF